MKEEEKMRLKIEVVFEPPTIKMGEETQIMYLIDNDSKNQYKILRRKGKIIDPHGNIKQFSIWQPLNKIVPPHMKSTYPLFKAKNPQKYYDMDKKGIWYLEEEIEVEEPEGTYILRKMAEISIL